MSNNEDNYCCMNSGFQEKSSIIMEPGHFIHCNNHDIKTTHIFH